MGGGNESARRGALPQSLCERIQSKVIRLSHQADPDSMLSCAHWNSIVLEERRVRRAPLVSSIH
jgi:hypothetical protein